LSGIKEVAAKVKQDTEIMQLARDVLKILVVITFVGGVLFISAGRISWISAWLLLLFYLVYLVLVVIWGIRNSPELIIERGKFESNVKSWDKLINALYVVFLMIMLVIMGFDSQRYGWTNMPIGFQVLGFIVMICSAWLIWRSMAENTFASRWARIQEEREQRVVTTGPYLYVRHPMYIGVIFLVFSSSLALGSLWGFVPGALIGLLYIIRTILEDRMLTKELVGYKAYALKVKYRLIPGIW
jgi:protein-S-isoprenylcysteine O-methyltransferase Ste14